jgi:raffinose/stachyose/melibiose transport system permease protein
MTHDRRAAPAAGSIERGSSTMRQRDTSSLRFLLPALALYVVIVMVPIVGGLPLSLVSWNGISHPIFRGVANFGNVLGSQDFRTALKHTTLILLIFMVLANTVGIGVALLLHSRPRGYRVYQTLIFLPAVVSLVATGFIWTLMLDPTIGLLPATLNALHLNSVNELWLADPRFALLSVTFVAWWQWGGISIVIYGAGLRSVPLDVLEAAEMDGASRWQRFWHITLPLMRPARAIVTILLFITVAQIFDVVYVLEGIQGAPARATDVVGLLIYRAAFGGGSLSTDSDLGLAEANAVAVMLILGVTLGLIQWYFRRRAVDYS